ncbi:hypothetical protein [Thauera sp. 2A1]|uniref:hypothetical protein n=1 Tax=Thauera sp. 2A1 TaxID=2570191 RepID=UPI00129097DC|nr:hypothetical protein [Thauera sp. 2A1]KAI5912180.1 hypothetical protein GH664_23065 [Thauera sp. 2A1]KAI5915004.1 hypothetical protein GH664_09320 [Thauera sp. 2A1]
MSADRIIYCLERLSDYRDFERLSSALLAGAGYPGIDPLGGTGDGGRDAIVRSDASNRTIGFAYTVREDWRVKFKGDCDRLTEKKYKLDALVFVCTEALSASEKDWAHALVAEKYGWKLDLFDLERLRVQLAGPQRHLLAEHPSVFTPPFFPQRGGQSVVESPDLLVLDHVDADHALSTWLARRLALAGYSTWCRGTAPLAGENTDQTIRILLDSRAAQYLPVLSNASLADSIFLERCVIAGAKNDLVLPCTVGLPLGSRLPSKLRSLTSAEFGASWMKGLESIFGRLRALGLAPKLDAARGRSIALGDYLPTRMTVAKPEPVYSNVFSLQLPDLMKTFDLRHTPKEEEIEAWRQTWPCARIGESAFASFYEPPASVKVANRGQFLWREMSERNGRRTRDIAKEVTRRSLEVVCIQKGLKFCTDRRVFYYPKREAGEWVQPIRHVDGRNTTVQLTGERTKGFGDRASLFYYQLAPRFSPQCDEEGNWTVLVRPYIRVTTAEGMLFEGKEIGRRRKIVSKQWWNNKWLPRLLGLVQGIETSPGVIQFGEGNAAVVMKSTPLSWNCPVGLDVAAISGVYDMGEELAEYRTRDDDESDDETTASPEGATEA